MSKYSKKYLEREIIFRLIIHLFFVVYRQNIYVYYNWEILSWKRHDFILIENQGVLIGHVKLVGVKSFVSFVNMKNERGDIVLVKWGVYTLDNWDRITSRQLYGFESNNHIFSSMTISLVFLKMLDIDNISHVIDCHLERIKWKNRVSVNDIIRSRKF